MLIELAFAFASWVGQETFMTEYTATSISVEAPSVCHQRAVERTVVVLPHKNPVRVLWADLKAHNANGLAFVGSRAVVLSTRVPCSYVPSTLAHEWAHQATADYFGGGQQAADDAIGRENVERVADCASETLTKRMGALRYAPYIDGRVDGYRGHKGCPKPMRQLSEELIRE